MKQGVRNFRTLVSLLALFSLLTMGASMLYSQTATSGVVVGVVTDPTGAVVRGATVTMVETATNYTLTATTDSGGRYIFPVVAPGEYTLTIVAKGFRKTTVNKLVVEVNKSATVDQTLTVGAATEIVEVTASGMTELQTTDSSLGEVLSGTELNRLPVQGRSAAQLIFYQAGVAPDVGTGDTTGGQIAGARSDQVTFTIDGGDATSDLEGSNNYTSPGQESSAVSPVVPVPQDSLDEFRVATNNANATFGSSSGGQINFITKSGTNAFHGSLYEYHGDNGLNANGWTNNHNGVAKPPSVDNRFGVGVGGPIIKNKLFFYGFYEGRRFHDQSEVDRIVPTDSFKSGYIEYLDDSKVLHQENFNPANGALAADCGGGACDPRGLGISPVILAQLALYPKGNNTGEGDGLNTIGLTVPVATPTSLNMGKMKLNDIINNKWSVFGSWQYASTARAGSEQVSLLTNPASSVSADPYFSNFFTFQLQGQISPTFLSVTHGSYLKNWWGWSRATPAPLVSGTDQALQLGGEGLGGQASFGGSSKLLADPININTQQARPRVWDGHDWYVGQDFTKVMGAHTVQFGGEGRVWHDYHFRTDQVLGGLTTAPINYVGAIDQAENGYATISGAYQPTSLPSDGSFNSYWNGYYTMLLGIVDHSAQVETRNGNFQPNPLGTATAAHVTLPQFNLYFQDAWKARRNLTVSVGLNWGVQLAPSEAKGLEAVLVYADSNTPVNLHQYLTSRAAALESGASYNPMFGISPVNSLAAPFNGRARQTVWKDIGPHISAAWQINSKTVVRGGYGLVFDRSSAVTSVLGGLLSGGLADVDTCGGPTFNGSGTAVCSQLPSDPTTAYRLGPTAGGWDGSSVPVPAPVANPIPWVPQGFGLTRSYGTDAYLTPGYAHTIDVTIQRTLPHNHFLEVGYVGRLSRNLSEATSFNSPDMRQKDSASGQTYAQAFDAVNASNYPGGSLSPQPFFENQMITAGPNQVCTAGNGSCTATAQFIDTLVGPGNFWLFDLYMNYPGFLSAAGGYNNPTSNTQIELTSQTSHGGFADYNAMVVTLRKAMSHGLQYQVNYTWSHDIGNQGINQQYIYSPSNPYDFSLDRSAEAFDHRQTMTGLWYYELPFGKGKTYGTGSGVLDRIVGGWSTSGIFSFYTGAPACAFNGNGNEGSPFSNSPCMVPTTAAALPSWGNHNLNVFADPAAILASLRSPTLTEMSTPGYHLSYDQMRSFKYWNFDLNLAKKFAITERVGLSMSADAFNVFNHVTFNSPSLDVTNQAAFGVITSQFAPGISPTGARILQLGVRLEF